MSFYWRQQEDELTESTSGTLVLILTIDADFEVLNFTSILDICWGLYSQISLKPSVLQFTSCTMAGCRMIRIFKISHTYGLN